MSFTVSKKIRKCGYYPDLGIQEPAEDITVDVTYEVTGIKSVYGQLGIATYSMSTPECSVAGERDFEFEWSGSGNPLEAAELALEKALQ
ncbi:MULTISPECIES: hypothetical protein [Klebsiella/Raoultella group]|jgi:hypothetical protein|uniref:hypothetical protein n=1 Tax=Klebsiella/Raoultella group TaxID=2890311 RepID=UPI000808A1F6|nr:MULTISPECIES: hypothetical protein [Klebsiella]HDT5741983.1 hypothetical protein [Klebsiella quasipneumoniae subsp. similipneumoniae]HEC2580271.1 hypothetical protein [Raoultella ornithinolytica]AWQ53197.1 hypothetical protein BH367_14465 [Klebsiella pneumoniae]AWQ53409.1 hypothetical protein BH367_15595 [Klebsiella pneumoniae]EKU5572642.1 hypothetical protein [Klebsiella pneumoniae]